MGRLHSTFVPGPCPKFSAHFASAAACRPRAASLPAARCAASQTRCLSPSHSGPTPSRCIAQFGCHEHSPPGLHPGARCACRTVIPAQVRHLSGSSYTGHGVRHSVVEMTISPMAPFYPLINSCARAPGSLPPERRSRMPTGLAHVFTSQDWAPRIRSSRGACHLSHRTIGL